MNAFAIISLLVITAGILIGMWRFHSKIESLINSLPPEKQKIWNTALRITENICYGILILATIYAISQTKSGEQILEILIFVVVLLAITVPFGIMIIYQTTKNSRQLTFVPTGSIRFGAVGETITDVWVNVPGTTYDKEKDEITETTAPAPTKEKSLWKRIFKRFFKDFDITQGIFYVSILYPLKQVHSWEFNWSKSEAKTKEVDGIKVLEGFELVHRHERVRDLYYQFLIPGRATEVELDGNFTVTIDVRVTLVVKKPRHLIGILKGKFMDQLMREISGLLENGIKHLNVDDFRAADKAQLIKEILSPGKPLVDGAMLVKSAVYVSFDFDPASKEVLEAKAKAIREGEAASAKQEADARNLAIKTKAEAEALVVKTEAEAQASINEALKKVREAEAAATARKLDIGADAYETEKLLNQVTATPEAFAAYKVMAEKDTVVTVAEAQRDAAIAVANAHKEAITGSKGNTFILGGNAQPLVMTGNQSTKKEGES